MTISTFTFQAIRKIIPNRINVLTATMIIGFPVPAHAQTCEPIESTKLLAGDGTEEDEFGYSVSIHENTAIVGARYSDDLGHNSGAAYVFIRSNGVWTQQAKLLPTDGQSQDFFGISVSISGDTVVVGAVIDDDNGPFSGSAYVFTRNDGIWTQQAKLFPDDGAEGDRFGLSVSICDNTVVIGSHKDDDNATDSGSAYVFARTGNIWTQQAKLLPSEGSVEDWFGYTVSISDNTTIIGAVKDDDNGTDSGSAYIFVRNGNTWTQQAKLLATDGIMNDWFGFSCSISADTAIIGARTADDNGFASGSAYAFIRNDGIWTQQAKLLPNDGAAGKLFGDSVSIHGNIAAIGARGDDDNGPASGSAYLFIRNQSIWSQHAKLIPADGETTDWFGDSIAVNDNFAVVAALRDDDSGLNAGATYIFDLNCSTICSADLTGDGLLNFFDVSAFLQAFNTQDPIADFTNDGIWDFFDVSAFLQAFAAGCP